MITVELKDMFQYHLITYRVLHPNLRASPWWNPSDFTITNTLQAMFHDPSKGKAIQQQLDNMIAMKRGTLRDIRPPDIVDHQIKGIQTSIYFDIYKCI